MCEGESNGGTCAHRGAPRGNVLVEQALAILKRYIDDNHGGVRVSATEALGLSNTTLSQWLTGKRTPNLESLDGPFSVIGAGFCVSSRQDDESDEGSDDDACADREGSCFDVLRTALRMELAGGMTQVRLSEATGVAQSSISRIVNGGRDVKESVLASLLTYFGGRVVIPGVNDDAKAVAHRPAAPEPSAEEERLRRRVAELKDELVEARLDKERALREQAERLFGVMAGGRTQVQAAPAVAEKRIPGTMPRDIRCSDSE